MAEFDWLQYLQPRPRMSTPGPQVSRPGFTPQLPEAPWLSDTMAGKFLADPNMPSQPYVTPGSVDPTAEPPTLVKPLQWLARKALTNIPGMPVEPAVDPTAEAKAAEAKTQMTSYQDMLMQALQPQRTSITIPGGIGLPTPRLPKPPDFTAARRSLMESQPTPIEPQSEQENLSSILGAAASAGAQGKTVGQTLALAGGALAGQYASNKAGERKRKDVDQERQREFNRTLAQFEMQEAKTKYEAEWQRSVMEYQVAIRQAEIAQPKIQVTTNGIVVQKRSAQGTEIEFIPNEVLGTSGALGKDARKKAGLIGGAPLLAEMRARVSAAPGASGKQLAIASSIVQHLVRGGQLQLPAVTDDEAGKKAVYKTNAPLFGEYGPAMPKMLETAQSRAMTVTRGMGLNPGSKEFHELFLQNYYNMIGTVLIENPPLFNRWFAVTFGTVGR